MAEECTSLAPASLDQILMMFGRILTGTVRIGVTFHKAAGIFTLYVA
jgi:hypothetical protein